MASRQEKRKLKNRNAMKKYVQMILDAVEKIGCAVHDIFVYAAHAVQVPEWFRPEREVDRFLKVRDEGVEVHPDYAVPKCVVAFASAIHASPSPQAFFEAVLARARRRARAAAEVASAVPA